ncbi:MAG TPA: hypothetical protein DEP87_03870 [Candidatus Pacebacteria bacterium]|nr:hypothetical protein [Candidatus Paceibacterota bacterium]
MNKSQKFILNPQPHYSIEIAVTKKPKLISNKVLEKALALVKKGEKIRKEYSSSLHANIVSC